MTERFGGQQGFLCILGIKLNRLNFVKYYGY
jgi:hypothetical protein